MKPRLRILHLEDNKNDAEIVEAALTNGEIECDIVLVDNQADFSAAIGKGRIDMIISDYSLPSFDGLAALAIAREKCPKIPFIFISGAMGEEKAVETLKLGARDYVLKDRLSHLVPAVHRALREVHEEELEEMNKILKAKYEIQREFISTVSHELRTPMNAILGFSSLLAMTPLNEKQTSYINQVQSSGQLLLGIIDDILDFSKLEAGKIKLESLDFNLEDLIHDAFKMAAVKMKGRPFEIYVDMEFGLHPYVKGDPMRLKQIFVNLLGNAFKFTSKGSIGIIVKKQSPSQDPDLLEYLFTVQDTGIGIAQENIRKLFNPFTQADSSTTRNFGGTGLGLSICKFLVEAMGGRIWVESDLGHGSRFMFTVKFKKGSSAEQEHPDDHRKILEGKRVFIIDDNQIARVILGKCCDQMGLKSLGEAESPQGALQKLNGFLTEQGAVPDLVLCDIIMEGMNGHELVEKIKSKEEFKKVKFIAVTSDITAEAAVQKKNELFDAYIFKPINVKGLTDVITKVMGYQRKVVFKESVEESSLKDIKVLVAEDSLVNQMLMQEYFNQLDCQVAFANNGKEAVEKLRSNRYNLVFMDLQMPIMGGIEATAIIRREVSKDIPIIALTASVMKADQLNAIAVDMSDFLTKPVSLEKLREKIEQYGRKEAGQKNGYTLKKEFIEEKSRQLQIPVEVVIRLIHTTISEVEAQLVLLENAIEQSDYANIRLISHHIRGFLSNLKLDPLASSAHEINALASQQSDIEGIKSILKQFKAGFESLRQDVSNR